MLIEMREWMDKCWVRWIAVCRAMVTGLVCEGGGSGHVVPRISI